MAYVQHRGGPAGFLRVLDEQRLACADFRGNKQYISLGNLAANDRASLFLMDYAGRQRLKIYARVEVVDLANAPDLAAELSHPEYNAKVERAFVFHLEAFNWNCPQHITPRFTLAQIEEGLGAIRDRIAHLESENAALRARLEPGEA
jgi:predicted pyridoxine 5'-phosphate oxidase superfamily flavin-nucleotide-binding protein